MNHLYQLTDPNDVIRYVGLTDDPERRLAEHLARARRAATPVGFWIRGLAVGGAMPAMKIIESFEDDGRPIEDFWIRRQWEQGWPLLNIQCLGQLRNPKHEAAWSPCDYAMLAHQAGRNALYWMRIENLMARRAQERYPDGGFVTEWPDYPAHRQRFIDSGLTMFVGPDTSRPMSGRPAILRRLGVRMASA